MCSRSQSEILFGGNTSVTYKLNKAGVSGGAIYSQEKCAIMFHENSTVRFISNRATDGGAVYSTT